jgi:hypothetical protein
MREDVCFSPKTFLSFYSSTSTQEQNSFQSGSTSSLSVTFRKASIALNNHPLSKAIKDFPRLKKVREFIFSNLPKEVDFIEKIKQNIGQYTNSPSQLLFPQLPCFLISPNLFLDTLIEGYCDEIKANVVFFNNTLSKNESSYSLSFIDECKILFKESFSSFQQVTKYIHKNKIPFTPFFIVFRSFEASISLISFLRLLLDYRKIEKINFVLIFLSEIVRPIESVLLFVNFIHFTLF